MIKSDRYLTMLYNRTHIFYSDVTYMARCHGIRYALKFIFEHIWNFSITCFYEKQLNHKLFALPGWIEIRTISCHDSQKYLLDLENAGVGSDVSNFKRGAICYLAYVSGKPVGLGWKFKSSLLLQAIDINDQAVYLGGFNTRKELRGKGIYPLLLQYICADIDYSKSLAVAQISINNHSSQRGLIKVGFTKKGTLITFSFFAHIIYWKLINKEHDNASD